MVRTQIYLEDDQSKQLKLAVEQADKSFSEIIREAVDQWLTKNQQTRPNGAQALLDLAKWAEENNLTGPTDLSTNHDDYLYGDKE